jgi:hypothetical protein
MLRHSILGGAVTALLLSTPVGAQYIDPPASPTNEDCDELYRQYRDLAEATVDQGFAQCDQYGLREGAECKDEVLVEQRAIFDELRDAVEACRIRAGDQAAGTRYIARQIGELYEQYQELQEVVSNPVRFYQSALSPDLVDDLTIDFGAGRTVNVEGQMIYDHVVKAAELSADASSDYVHPLVSAYNQELLDHLVARFRALIDQMAALEYEIDQLEAGR